MQAWVLEKIEGAFPPSNVVNAIEALNTVRAFFGGSRGLLFGMTTTPDAFSDPEALVRRANEGLRAWFDHYGEIGDFEEQALVYYRISHLFPDRPQPELVRERFAKSEAREAAIRNALAGIPRPLEAVAMVSEPLAAALRNVRGKRTDSFFEKAGDVLDPTGERSMESFDWEEPDPEWDELVEGMFDPPFFPFAGQDGDYIGVIVLPEAAPVMHFSHEEGFAFIAQSLEHWNAMCALAAKRGRGLKKALLAAQGELPEGGDRDAAKASAYWAAFVAARAALRALPS